MKGEYPPGTSRRDLENAGIIDKEVPCPECDKILSHGEEHEEWCEAKDMTVQEARGYWAEECIAT